MDDYDDNAIKAQFSNWKKSKIVSFHLINPQVLLTGVVPDGGQQ